MLLSVEVQKKRSTISTRINSFFLPRGIEASLLLTSWIARVNIESKTRFLGPRESSWIVEVSPCAFDPRGGVS